MRTLQSMLLMVVVCLGSLGCGGDTGPDAKDVKMSIILIEFPSGDPLRVTGGSVGKVQINENLSVAVQNGRLIVNDKDYGVCNPGDKVKIEAGNAVKVNGEARQAGKAP